MNDSTPSLAPNDAALALLKDMATEQRAMAESVAKLREHAAKLDGLDVNERLKALAGENRSFREELAGLKARLDIADAARKPWVFVAREITKLLLAVAIGAATVAFGMNSSGHH